MDQINVLKIKMHCIIYNIIVIINNSAVMATGKINGFRCQDSQKHKFTILVVFRDY